MKIEPIWKDEAVVIVAGGSSFTAAQSRIIAMAKTRNMVKVIAINDAVYPCWYADMVYACDAKWWRYHGSLPGFSGRKFRAATIKDGVDTNHVDIPDLEAIEISGTEGFDPDPGFIRSGGNSGYQALHLAAHLGVGTAILVGYDMRGTHWFGEQPESIRSYPDMRKWVTAFVLLAEALRERGVSVINATHGSALTMFPQAYLPTEIGRLAQKSAG